MFRHCITPILLRSLLKFQYGLALGSGRAMPPKRPRPDSAGGQKSIASFFSPPKPPSRGAQPTPTPTKGTINAAKGGKRNIEEVVEVSDSDDEIVFAGTGNGKRARVAEENGRANEVEVKTAELAETVEIRDAKEETAGKDGESDEALAHRLAAEWAAEDATGPASQAQAKEEVNEAEEVKDVKIEEGKEDKAAKVEVGASPPAKPNIHPLFARATEAGPSRSPSTAATKQTDSPRKETRKATLAVSRTLPVEPIDFDVDSLLFRPASVDISAWPQGRLPYSVLVGVYVQVSATRSRLLIVRILTK